MLKHTLLLAAVLSLIGCGHPTDGAADSSLNATVTPQQFGEAMGLIEDSKSYVAYDEPGTCYARALWGSALLGAAGIPSSAYFAFPPRGESLQGPNNIPWSYHVAVMIHATDSQEQMILDPTLSPGPIADRAWLDRMGGRATTLIVPGSIQAERVGPSGEFRTSNIVSSFDEMPKFRQADVEKACGVIQQFQNTMRGINVQQAQAKLHSEMIRISAALQARGKVDFGVLTPGSVYCGRTRISPR